MTPSIPGWMVQTYSMVPAASIVAVKISPPG